MPDKIYCYPDSDVLKNRMGIRDMEQLRRVTPSVKATDAASVSLSEP